MPNPGQSTQSPCRAGRTFQKEGVGSSEEGVGSSEEGVGSSTEGVGSNEEGVGSTTDRPASNRYLNFILYRQMKKNSTLYTFKQLRSYCLYLALFKKKVK